jgi:hypothetical protein
VRQCARSSNCRAPQAKREIGKLWEDITKAPYKQLFNAGVPGPVVWEAIQALRAVQASLQVQAKNYGGRDALVCVHGNRFIEWASLRALGMKPGELFANFASAVPNAVQKTVAAVVTGVKASYADSYPASLFKNLGKCRALAAKIA